MVEKMIGIRELTIVECVIDSPLRGARNFEEGIAIDGAATSSCDQKYVNEIKSTARAPALEHRFSKGERPRPARYSPAKACGEKGKET